MSLILFYRDCFTADISLINQHGGEPEIYDKRQKTYLSEDKHMAGMSCGLVLTSSQWLVVRDIIDLYLANVVNNPTDAEKLVNTELSSLVTSDWCKSSIVIAIKDFLFHFKYYPDLGGDLEKINPNVPFMAGTGSSAARMLINSGRELSQQDFFRIVSLSERFVSNEYTCIELKDVIDTPWYKEKI